MGILAAAYALPQEQNKMSDWLSILALVISSGGVAGLVSLVTLYASRRKTTAEADKIQADAAQTYEAINNSRWASIQVQIQAMQSRIDEQDKIIRAQATRITELEEAVERRDRIIAAYQTWHKQIDDLGPEVIAHGMNPLPKPNLPEVK